jgi:hypothetical protein
MTFFIVPLMNTPSRRKKFPERRPQSITNSNFRPEIGEKESKPMAALAFWPFWLKAPAVYD